MTHFTTTTLSTITLSTYTTLLTGITDNATLNEINATTTFLPPRHEGPPSSPYNVTQMIIIAIVATILALLTVVGNVMVCCLIMHFNKLRLALDASTICVK